MRNPSDEQLETAWTLLQAQVARTSRPRKRKARCHNGHAAYKPSAGNRRCWTCRADTLRARSYGLSASEYEALRLNQQGACAICRRTDKRLGIDHDHATGKVRGLLCHGCNAGIGMFRDDPKSLAAAIEYLARKR